MKKIHFWETKETICLYSIAEVEERLKFSYLPTIRFQNRLIQKNLHQKGIKAFQEGNISEHYISQGNQWENKIKEGFIAPSLLKYIDEQVGYGLFAAEDLSQGSFIGEYAGIVRENNNHLWISDYLYSYPLQDEIGRNYVIDAHSGSLTRFINHSYQPNLQATYAYIDGFFHMILLVISPIRKGTQFTFNYGKNYWYVRSPPKELSDIHH